MAQTYKDYEIILINDQSPDNVGEVVGKYIKRHPGVRFVYLEQENRGLGGARNTGIRHASGEIIAILDQDDIWYPEKLGKVAAVFKREPGAAVVCHRQYIRQDGRITGACSCGAYVPTMHRRLLFAGNSLSTSATSFRKTVIDKVGGFSEQTEKLHFVEDYDLWLRIARGGLKFVFLPEILGEYLIHEANYSTQSYERMCRSEQYVIASHYNLLSDKRWWDWYLFRRRRSRSYFIWAQRIAAKHGLNAVALKYFGKMMISDPLFIAAYILIGSIKAVKKALRGS